MRLYDDIQFISTELDIELLQRCRFESEMKALGHYKPMSRNVLLRRCEVFPQDTANTVLYINATEIGLELFQQEWQLRKPIVVIGAGFDVHNWTPHSIANDLGLCTEDMISYANVKRSIVSKNVQHLCEGFKNKTG